MHTLGALDFAAKRGAPLPLLMFWIDPVTDHYYLMHTYKEGGTDEYYYEAFARGYSGSSL